MPRRVVKPAALIAEQRDRYQSRAEESQHAALVAAAARVEARRRELKGRREDLTIHEAAELVRLEHEHDEWRARERRRARMTSAERRAEGRLHRAQLVERARARTDDLLAAERPIEAPTTDTDRKAPR